MTSKIVPAIDNTTGRVGRINLSGATNLDFSQNNYSTGMDIEAIYLQPRAKRVIVEWYSHWDDGRGRCRGTSYEIADDETIAKLARYFDSEELAGLLPEFKDE